LSLFTFKKQVPSSNGAYLITTAQKNYAYTPEVSVVHLEVIRTIDLAFVKSDVAPDPEIGLEVDVVHVEVDLEVGVVPRLAPLLLRLVIRALQEGDAALSRL